MKIKLSVCIIGILSLYLLMPVVVLGTEIDAEENRTLRMALLPVPDVLPVYVAHEKGYFKELGIEVKSLPVSSAMDRDQLMQAGRVDGMINEISGAISL